MSLEGRSSLFASPLPKSKNVIPAANDNNVSEVVPMEVDSGLIENKEEQPGPSLTPRRKSVPSMGKRRSISFPKPENEVKNNTENESSVFELLSETNDDPHSEVFKQMDQYSERLDSHIGKFDFLLERQKKKLDSARERSAMQYVTRNPSLGKPKMDLPTFEIGNPREPTPAEKVARLMSDFRKITPDPSATQSTDYVTALDDVHRRKQLALKKLEMLKALEEKYRLEEEADYQLLETTKEYARLVQEHISKSRELMEVLQNMESV